MINIGDKRVTKVDDGVFELTFASRGGTDAASLVVLSASTYLVVTHMLSAAFEAKLKISIAVDL